MTFETTLVFKASAAWSTSQASKANVPCIQSHIV